MTKPHVHFMGIGGIGMSALALIAHARGYEISGCDPDEHAPMNASLRAIGCTIWHAHNAQHLDFCLSKSAHVTLVYSTAIAHDNPELQHARAQNSAVLHRAEFLALLAREQETIAVSGAHGKTTTTALIAHILTSSHYDPTYVVGGILANTGTNGYAGRTPLFVIEADESDRSMLLLRPHIAIVTNVDQEHLNEYRDLADVQDALGMFARNTQPGGTVVLSADDPHSQPLFSYTHEKTVTFGFSEHADVRASSVELFPAYSTCTVTTKNRSFALTIPLPGLHNVSNVIAAIAALEQYAIPSTTLVDAIATFRGVARRFEYKGTYNGADIFDDYGHHPNEIRHAIATARRRAKKRLIVAFQPQRYTRTAHLWDMFVDVLSECDTDLLYITDICPASEKPIENITSDRLVHQIATQNTYALPKKQILYAPFETLESNMRTLLQPGDLLLTLGAGKLYTVAEHLASECTMQTAESSGRNVPETC